MSMLCWLSMYTVAKPGKDCLLPPPFAVDPKSPACHNCRDVFVQRNMFVEPFLVSAGVAIAFKCPFRPLADVTCLQDDLLHFPRESGAYRLRGPFSLNADWMTQCYGRSAMAASG